MCSHLHLFAFEFVSKFIIIITEPDYCPIPLEIIYQLFSMVIRESEFRDKKEKKKRKVEKKIIEEQ